MVDTSYVRRDGQLTWRALSYWAPGCPILFPFALHNPRDGRTYKITSYTDDCLNDLYKKGLQTRILTDSRIRAMEVA